MKMIARHVSLLLFPLLCLSLLAPPAWAARGFDTTDGVGSTDVVTTTHASNNTNTSWCVWVYRTGNSGSGNGRILDKDTAANGNRIIYEDSGGNKYQLEVDWSGGMGRWSTPRPSATAWHQFCITYNGGATTNNPVMYIDGSSVTVTTAVVPIGTLDTGSSVYTIGNRADGIRVWNGRIAEVAIWEGTILTAGNVSTLWNSGAGARADSITTPTAYWALCGTASPEPNEIGGGSTGVLTGTAFQAHPFSNCSGGVAALSSGSGHLSVILHP